MNSIYISFRSSVGGSNLATLQGVAFLHYVETWPPHRAPSFKTMRIDPVKRRQIDSHDDGAIKGSCNRDLKANAWGFNMTKSCKFGNKR